MSQASAEKNEMEKALRLEKTEVLLNTRYRFLPMQPNKRDVVVTEKMKKPLEWKGKEETPSPMTHTDAMLETRYAMQTSMIPCHVRSCSSCV